MIKKPLLSALVVILLLGSLVSSKAAQEKGQSPIASNKYAFSLSLSGISYGQGSFKTEEGVESLSADIDFKNSFGVSAAISRRAESFPIRTEVEILYRKSDSDNGSIRLFWVDADLDCNLKYLAGMLNFYYEVPLSSLGMDRWRLDAGIGIGYALSKTEILISLDSDEVGGALSQWDFCQQLILGISRPVGEHFEWFLNYRCLLPGEILNEPNRVDLPVMHHAELGARVFF